MPDDEAKPTPRGAPRFSARRGHYDIVHRLECDVRGDAVHVDYYRQDCADALAEIKRLRDLVREHMERLDANPKPTPPWQEPPLDEWAIVGMNHYPQNGSRFLFVAMTREGNCITAEGPDQLALWQGLRIKAGRGCK